MVCRSLHKLSHLIQRRKDNLPLQFVCCICFFCWIKYWLYKLKFDVEFSFSDFSCISLEFKDLYQWWISEIFQFFVEFDVEGLKFSLLQVLHFCSLIPVSNHPSKPRIVQTDTRRNRELKWTGMVSILSPAVVIRIEVFGPISDRTDRCPPLLTSTTASILDFYCEPLSPSSGFKLQFLISTLIICQLSSRPNSYFLN